MIDRAKALVDAGRLDAAIAILEEALEGEPGDPEILEAFVHVLDRAGRYDRALALLENSKAKLTPSLKKLNDRIKRKRHIYKHISRAIPGADDYESYIGTDDFVTLTSGPLLFRWHIKNPNIDPAGLLRAGRRALVEVGSALDYQPERVEIEVYDSKTELRDRARRELDRSYPSWIGGVYDGKIRLSTNDQTTPEPQYLFMLLSHEYVHLVVDTLGRGRCPYWLNEGLAIRLSQELPKAYTEELAKAASEGSLFDLVELENDFTRFSDPGPRRLAYAQAADVVRYLVDRCSWEKMRELLREIPTSGIEEALGSLSLNYYLIEKDWKRDLRKRMRKMQAGGAQ